MRPYAKPVPPIAGPGAVGLLAMLEDLGEYALADRMLSRAATEAERGAPLETCELYQAATDALERRRRKIVS